MDKKKNEGEMGSGDSDDEFYNVKMPCTASDVSKSYKKSEVKKVYSPPRTKVQYDYKFDSSSDEDSENSGRKSSKSKDKMKEEGTKENKNLPQSTFKVVEKINEELKNMKNAGKTKPEESSSQNHIATSIASAVQAVSQSLVPPVMVVPSQMVVPQATVMNMGPMIVPSPIGMAMMPSQNMMGNMLRGANLVPGVMGNMIGLQGGMINPAQINMMRMAGAGNAMLRMQTPASNLLTASNIMGIARPNGNVIGVPRVNIPPPPANLMVGTGVVNNPMVVMSNMVANQAANNAVRMINNPPVRPPPFVKGTPPPPNFRWQTPKMPNLPKPGSSTSQSSPSAPSPSSSPVDKDSKDYDGDELSREDSDEKSFAETDESQSPPREMPNTFKNDGSFMELFKKMKEEESNQEKSNAEKSEKSAEVSEATSTLKKPTVMLSGIVGKRRGGRVLKTGLVKKVKKESEQDEEKHPKDAWSMYMAEVKKYREASCEEEGKTRPLVK